MKTTQKAKAQSEQEFTVDGLSLKVKPLTIQFNKTAQSTTTSAKNRAPEADSSRRLLSTEMNKASSSSASSADLHEELDRKGRLLARLQEISVKRSEQEPEPQRKLKITYIPSSDSDCSRQASPPLQKNKPTVSSSRTVEVIVNEKKQADIKSLEKALLQDENISTTEEINKVHGGDKTSVREKERKPDRSDDNKISIPLTFEKSRITFPKVEETTERPKEQKQTEPVKKPLAEKSPVPSGREKRSLPVGSEHRRGKSLDEKKNKTDDSEEPRRKSDRVKDTRRSPITVERKREEPLPRRKIPSLLDPMLRKRSATLGESEEQETKTIRVAVSRPDISDRRNPHRNGKRSHINEQRTPREPEVIEFEIPKVIPASPEPIIPFFTNVYIFSNHFRCPTLEIDGRRYCCTEQYYMWQKAISCKDTRSAKRIMDTKDPKEMKYISMNLRAFDPVAWDKIKWKVMLKANYQKYSQYSALRHQLFRTVGCCIVEASPLDTYWGVGLDIDSKDLSNPEQWKGKNQMGEVLMAIRDELMTFPEYAEEVEQARQNLFMNTIEKASNGVHSNGINAQNGTAESSESEMENN